jgi:ribonuclease HI
MSVNQSVVPRQFWQ